MSTLTPPPISSVASARPARGAHALDEPRAERRAGLVGTVLVHVVLIGLFLVLPDDWLEAPKTAGASGETNRPFEIELSPELLTPVEPVPVPERFVEVNREAPENVPDETEFFGAQNQQVAQPIPTPDGESDTPAVDGEGKEHDSSIVSGMRAEPVPPAMSETMAQAFVTPEQAQNEAIAEGAKQSAVNPLPGGENLLGESDGSPGSIVSPVSPVEGAESGIEVVRGESPRQARSGGYFAGTPAIDRTRPMTRPTLAAAGGVARPASLIANELGTKNVGTLAYDAKWSSYGEYLQEFWDIISENLTAAFRNTRVDITPGATVVVAFRLNRQGEISEIVSVEGSAREFVRRLAVSAITTPSPYRPWTDDMLATLGETQLMIITINF